MSEAQENAEAETENSTPPSNFEPPVRVLVQTLTHLVPGDSGHEKHVFLFNTICQYHWQCDFSVPKFRADAYNTKFAYNNRRCFFLVDYGTTENDGDVPILMYQWTGQSLKPFPKLASDTVVMFNLKTYYPFTRRDNVEPRKEYPVREMIRERLRSQDSFTKRQLKYMRDRPEDLEWLKRKVRLRLWQAFVKALNANRDPGDPEIEE